MEHLITLTDFDAYRHLTVNLDTLERLEPFVLESQRMDLEPVLGEALYDLLWNNVGDAGIYDALLVKVKPFLVYCTLVRFLRSHSVHITRYGIVKKTNEHSEPLGVSELKEFIDRVLNGSAYYQKKLVKFIEDNIADYPDFKTSCDNQIPYKNSIKITDV